MGPWLFLHAALVLCGAAFAWSALPIRLPDAQNMAFWMCALG
jgi:hypothetical protein